MKDKDGPGEEVFFELHSSDLTQGIYSSIDCILTLLSAQGKQMMFTVKNFYNKVEAS